MWVYLCLWRLQPYGRNSEPCPRHSRSLGKWKNSPPPQMWCPAQDGKIQKKKRSLGKKACDKSGTNHSCSFTRAIGPLQSCEKSTKYCHDKSCDYTVTFWEQLSSVAQTTGGSGQRQSTHMDERCAADGKGNRRSKTHMRMYTSKQTHSCHSANELICKGKWAAGVRQ